MRRCKGWLAAALLGLIYLAPGTVWAENEGQEALDRATEAKLTAENIEDLNQVIKLCQDALDAGLDKGNAEYANGLLAGTLVQRGEVYSAQLFAKSSSMARLRQLRQLALNDLERAVKLVPDSADAWHLIGRLNALPDGNRDRAVKALDEAIRLSEAEPARKVKALILRASLLTDPAKRQADYDAAVKLAPHNLDALRARGLYFILQNKPDAALRDLDTALSIDPEQAPVHEARAVALMLQKKFDEALKSLAKVIEQHEGSPAAYMAYVHRARIRAIQRDNKAALEDVNKAIAIEPRYPVALLLRARVYLQGGDSKKALADVEEVLRQRPGLVEALQLHAALSAGTGKVSQAIDDLEQLRQSIPDDADLLMQLGMLYSAGKKLDKALDTFNKLIAKDPKNWAAFRGRADTYLSLGKQGEAIGDYESALKIHSKETGVLNNLAWVLATSPEDKLRDGKRAIDLATQAAKLTDHKQAHILSTLAAAYAETGNFEEAIKWSQKALDVGDAKLKPQLTQELASYQSKKPWREATPPEDTQAAALDDDSDAKQPDAEPTPAKENPAEESIEDKFLDEPAASDPDKPAPDDEPAADDEPAFDDPDADPAGDADDDTTQESSDDADAFDNGLEVLEEGGSP